MLSGEVAFDDVFIKHIKAQPCISCRMCFFFSYLCFGLPFRRFTSSPKASQAELIRGCHYPFALQKLKHAQIEAAAKAKDDASKAATDEARATLLLKNRMELQDAQVTRLLVFLQNNNLTVT
jgi:hypothetical protein